MSEETRELNFNQEGKGNEGLYKLVEETKLLWKDAEFLRKHKTPEEKRKAVVDFYRKKAVEMGLMEEDFQGFGYRHFVSRRQEETDESFRTRYLAYTRDLIRKILKEGKECYVFFLDKSARPVYWLVQEFWDIFAGSAPKPQFRFVNIDKEKWNSIVGTNEEVPENSNVPTPIDVPRRAPEYVDALRKIFKINPGWKILIVDEVKSSGDTLEITRQFFKSAFPKNEVRGIYWMTVPIVVGKHGERMNKESPFWYNASSPWGRGVRDPEKPGEFLSKPLRGDRSAQEIRDEIKQMKEEVRKGYLPVPDIFPLYNQEL